MPELGPGVMPTLYEHCCKTYKAMFAKAKDYVAEGGIEMVVYEGMFTALITQELHFSNPLYTKIREALVSMGCIKQLRRGGNNTPSQWELLHEPSEEAFTRYMTKKAKGKVTKTEPDKYDILQQQVKALTNRVNRHDELLGMDN
jgi:hypothetical protein